MIKLLLGYIFKYNRIIYTLLLLYSIPYSYSIVYSIITLYYTL